MIFWELFASFFQIGLFSFGGGYVALPLIQQQIVTLHGWMTMEAFTDLITIAEMTPGPLAINSATFVGQQVAGLPGALVATFALILPSCVIVSLLAWAYKRYRTLSLMQGVLSGIRPAVVAMIASAGLGIIMTAVWPQGLHATWLQDADLIAVAVFVVSLFVLRKWKVNSILIIASAGVLGIVLALAGVM